MAVSYKALVTTLRSKQEELAERCFANDVALDINFASQKAYLIGGYKQILDNLIMYLADERDINAFVGMVKQAATVYKKQGVSVDRLLQTSNQTLKTLSEALPEYFDDVEFVRLCQAKLQRLVTVARTTLLNLQFET